MNRNVEVLALIPARGNSKSIPRKNIREFAGFPLIAYSIAAAKQARLVTRTIVSTDDEEIAAVSRKYGAETPFMRPAELARDRTQDYAVFEHALEWLAEEEGYAADIVVQLRPTSPIRPKNMVDEAISILIDYPKADSVRGVVPSMQNPYKMWHILDNGQLSPILTVEGIPEPYNAPRQQLPLTYWQTGHIDAMRSATILKKGSMTGDQILPLLIDPVYSVDIDTYLDWERAERCVLDGSIDMVLPGKPKRHFPERVRLLVLDFDGVLTDNRVWVDENGREWIAASRSDGMGLERLKKFTNIQPIVISKETNKVVAARCKKLDIPFIQSVEDKGKTLKKHLEKMDIPAQECVYVGNDLNDLACFPLVGFSVAPADAVHLVKREADLILESKGGFGAVREIAEKLIDRYQHVG